MSPISCRIAALAFCCAAAAIAPAVAAPRVVASIPPVHSLVAAVMQGVGEPRLLLRGGDSPHTFSLRPSDARVLHDADMLFWIGPALELPLTRILPNLRHATAVALLEAPGVELLPARELADHAHDGAGTAAAADEGTLPDPHLWLSPANAMAMSDAIAGALSDRDPANAERYAANAALLGRRLARLDDALRKQFAAVDGRFAVFHDAYQYLEHSYGLHSVGTVTTHPERSPGVAHLHALRETLRDSRAACLFSEPQFQPRLVAVLSEGLAIRHAVLDPLGADIVPGPQAYEQLMQQLADRFTDCMQGG